MGGREDRECVYIRVCVRLLMLYLKDSQASQADKFGSKKKEKNRKEHNAQNHQDSKITTTNNYNAPPEINWAVKILNATCSAVSCESVSEGRKEKVKGEEGKVCGHRS